MIRLASSDVWICSPCLVSGPAARNRLPEARHLPTLYRHIPRTMQKLWRGSASPATRSRASKRYG